MKKIIAAIFTTILTVIISLSSMYILDRTTLYVSTIASPLRWSMAVAAALFLGVTLLLGTVWIATHLSVRIFGKNLSSSPGGPRV
jgi:hypothetical protein